MFNIMIIDDSKVALKITEEILSKEVNAPLNIRKFSCAVEAKNKLLLFQPDLVITDIEMPNTNGYEVIEFIKEISDVPIIAVSGSTLKKMIPLLFYMLQI
ncbi:response regulator [Colwellia sp. TT2012]|uniref:response regulator n=1 Tax=Colwellia sp. TT2012 TaxID=1720342 RepID=UPI00070E8C5B|nr:response regulator [Colwellia sp. TT2012]